MMNRAAYMYGNPFRVFFWKHTCFHCKAKLRIGKEEKIIDKNSEEAEYYRFSLSAVDACITYPCQLIHPVFFCPVCQRKTEFRTQLSLEDNKKRMQKREKQIRKIFPDADIRVLWETVAGEETERQPDIEHMKSGSFSVKNATEEWRFPFAVVKRMKHGDREFIVKNVKGFRKGLKIAKFSQADK